MGEEGGESKVHGRAGDCRDNGAIPRGPSERSEELASEPSHPGRWSVQLPFPWSAGAPWSGDGLRQRLGKQQQACADTECALSPAGETEAAREDTGHVCPSSFHKWPHPKHFVYVQFSYSHKWESVFKCLSLLKGNYFNGVFVHVKKFLR